MADEHTMTIDRSYPFGNMSVEGEGGSAAGSQESGQGAQQQGAQPEQGAMPQGGEQQPGQEQPAQGQGGAQQGQAEEGQQVPLSVVQSIRQELQEAKQREAQWQAMVQQQQAQLQQPQQGQPAQEDALSQYDDDDVITVADMKKVLQQTQGQGQGQPQAQPQQFQQAPQQPQMSQPDPRELQMRSTYSDYDQTIQQLPNVLQQAPQLESAIRNSDNPYQTAYTLAKQMGGGQGQAQQAQPSQGERVQQNLQKPGTAGQVSGAGGIGKADYYANMSKDEFEKRRAQILRGG